MINKIRVKCTLDEYKEKFWPLIEAREHVFKTARCDGFADATMKSLVFNIGAKSIRLQWSVKEESDSRDYVDIDQALVLRWLRVNMFPRQVYHEGEMVMCGGCEDRHNCPGGEEWGGGWVDEFQETGKPLRVESYTRWGVRCVDAEGYSSLHYPFNGINNDDWIDLSPVSATSSSIATTGEQRSNSMSSDSNKDTNDLSTRELLARLFGKKAPAALLRWSVAPFKFVGRRAWAAVNPAFNTACLMGLVAGGFWIATNVKWEAFAELFSNILR